MTKAANEELDTFQPIGLTANKLVAHLIKLREFPEIFDGANVVSNGCLQRSFERTEMNGSSLENEPSIEAVAAIAVNAFEARGRAKMLLVGVILSAACLSKIGKGVVRAIPINMIDQVDRPLACNVEPSEAPSAVQFPVNPDEGIALRRTGAASSLPEKARARLYPSEDASRRFIVKNLPQSFQTQVIVKLMGQDNLPILIRHPRLGGRVSEKQTPRDQDNRAEKQRNEPREAEQQRSKLSVVVRSERFRSAI